MNEMHKRRFIKTTQTGLLVLFFILCINCGVFGAVLSYDGFNYGTGGLNGQSGGSGFGGAWDAPGIETTGTSLPVPPAYGHAMEEGSVQANMSGRSAKRRLGFDIDLNPASPQTYYFSVLFKRTDASNEGTGEWFSLFKVLDSGDNPVCNYGIGSGEGVFVQPLGDSGRTVSTTPGFVQIGATYLAVAKLVANPAGTNDQMFFKVYGPDTSSFPADLTFGNCDAKTAFDGNAVLTYMGFDFGSSQDVVHLDELWIGESFYDVVNTGFTPLFAHEDFDYGTSGLHGQTGGTGFGSAWNASGMETASASLPVPDGYGCVPGGGRVNANSSGRTASRELAFDINLDPSPGGDLIYYFSMLFRKDDSSSGGTGEWLILRLANRNDTSVVDYTIGSDESVSTRVQGGSPAATGAGFVEEGLSYLLVGKLLCRGGNTPQYTDTDDVSYIKVYKVGEDTVYTRPEYEAFWDAMASSDCSDTIEKVNINFGSEQDTVQIDELRIGTSWEEVVGNDGRRVEPISGYIRDTYLRCDPPGASILDVAAERDIMKVKPVVLPEGENFLGDNFHLGWPVAAMVGDTIIVHARRRIYHSASAACQAIYPHNNDEYSSEFFCRSTDAGKTWGPMIDTDPLFDNSGGTSVGGMLNIGTNEYGDFFIKGAGAALSDDGGKNWALYENAFAGCQTDDWEMGPRVVNHPVFGMLMFNSSNEPLYPPPYHTYIRRSQDGGLTWDNISWNTSMGGTNYTLPMEPAAVTWGPGHILLLSREHSQTVADDGKTWAMSQHVYEYESGDGFNTNDMVFTTQRSNIEGNRNAGRAANDTADLAYNPVTGRIEALQSARYGGGPGYDGNSQEVEMSTLNLWSISPDELLAGSNRWRFEGTLLLRNDHHSPGFRNDGLHPGGAVVDANNGVQHIYIYAGGHCAERNGVFQIDRTLNTGQLSAYLKSSVPNCQYTRRIDLDCTDLPGNAANSYLTVKLDPGTVTYSQFKADGSDLYFTDDRQYIQPHKILEWNAFGDSFILVKVPLLDASSGANHLFMHWGDTNAYFHQYDDEADPGLDSFAVSFWVKNDTTSGSYYMVHKGYNPGWLVYRSTTTLRFRLQGSYDCEMPGFSDTTGWHHVAAIIDRDANKMKLYVDSVLKGETDISAVGAVESPDSLAMEDDPDGSVEDIRMFRSVLDTAEISAMYNAGRGGYTEQSFSDPPIITVAAVDAVASEQGNDPAQYTVTRTGSTASDLTVHYYMGGTAADGIDYEKLFGSTTIPAGSGSAGIDLIPVCDQEVEPAETAVLTLLDGVDYDLGATTSATVTINNIGVLDIDIVR